MNNYKLVTIFILKHEKYANYYFYEDMLGKILGFDCMHENKIYIFCFFLYLLKRKLI
jgi:hypothetical protein